MPIERTEEPEKLSRYPHIIKYTGALEDDPYASMDFKFGSFSVVKDKDIGGKNEDRALVVELVDEDSNIVGLEIDVFDGNTSPGNGELAAETAAEEFSGSSTFEEGFNNTLNKFRSININGGGTCWAGFRVIGNKAEIGRIGDCRVTVWDKYGNLKFATKDETQVQKLVEKGWITNDESLNYDSTNPLIKYKLSRRLKEENSSLSELEIEEIIKTQYKNSSVISNSIYLGNHCSFNESNVFELELEEGDVVEICSDGRSGNFTDEEEIKNIKGKTVQEASAESFSKSTSRKPGDNKSKIIRSKKDNTTIAIYIHGGNFEDRVICQWIELNKLNKEARNRFTGKGKLVENNFLGRKVVYEGEFLNGKKHGNAKITDKDGIRYTRWENGKLTSTKDGLSEAEESWMDEPSKQTKRLRNTLLAAAGATVFTAAGAAYVVESLNNGEVNNEVKITAEEVDTHFINKLRFEFEKEILKENPDKEVLKKLIKEADTVIPLADTVQEKNFARSLTLIKLKAEEIVASN